LSALWVEGRADSRTWATVARRAQLRADTSFIVEMESRKD
jgi:hypothetical protein